MKKSIKHLAGCDLEQVGGGAECRVTVHRQWQYLWEALEEVVAGARGFWHLPQGWGITALPSSPPEAYQHPGDLEERLAAAGLSKGEPQRGLSRSVQTREGWRAR
jgi:hypothetical protein